MRSPPARCPDDLLARHRRGALSDVERRALDAHLGGCALCRTALTFGALCDEIPDQAGPGDGEVIARLAARVAAGRARPRRPARLLAYAAAVALFVTAGGAAAWMAVRRETIGEPASRARRRPIRESPRAPAAVAPEPTSPTSPLDVGAVVAPAIPPGQEVDPASPRHRLGTPRARSLPVAPVPTIATRATSAAAPESPASLFATANAARRAGRLRDAVSIYQRLESQYPTSVEAPVSLVSAADLLLRLGEPAPALVKLDRYLGASPPGPLAPEAMFARARCWRALGRPDDERNAWRALTGAFPGSIYEAAARRRLAELGP